jgi:hypothetical protein
MEDQQAFYKLVAQIIGKHPDWLAGLLFSIQSGIADALTKERGQKADLAYALSEFVPNITDKHARRMQPGIKALAQFFRGAPIESKINNLIIVESDQ